MEQNTFVTKRRANVGAPHRETRSRTNYEFFPDVACTDAGLTFGSEPSAFGGLLEQPPQGSLEVRLVLDHDSSGVLSYVSDVERDPREPRGH